jgi:hypothetical protein
MEESNSWMEQKWKEMLGSPRLMRLLPDERIVEVLEGLLGSLRGHLLTLTERIAIKGAIADAMLRFDRPERFVLTRTELQTRDAWLVEHQKVCPASQRYKLWYEISPSDGIGRSYYARCAICSARHDITDYSTS